MYPSNNNNMTKNNYINNLDKNDLNNSMDNIPSYPDNSSPQMNMVQQPTGLFDIDSVIKSIDNELKNNISNFSHQLMGEKKIVTQDSGGKFMERFETLENPIVNSLGRSSIISYISACATAWSDIKEREVRIESAELSTRFIKDLYMNMEKWGVQFKDLSALVMMVEKFIEYKIIRKVSEKKVWDVVQRTVNEQHTSSDSQKPRKGFSMFGGGY